MYNWLMSVKQPKSSSKQLEYRRRYYWKNREKFLIQMRLSGVKHRKARTEYRRKYRKTKNGKAATLKAIKKYEKNNPDRKKAWTKAQCIQLKPCRVCNKTPSHRHHPDISNPLKVEFLCPLHHKKAHQAVL